MSTLLVNTNVESFGVLHQSPYIQFREEQGDIELYFDAGVTFYPQRDDKLSEAERMLLGMNSVNLKRVVDAFCTDTADLEVRFDDGSWFRINGTSEEGNEPWQLSDGTSVDEGGILLIASSGDSNYAVWGSLE
ncbi:hypothetical protein [Hymenobacter canadensis]|uniref:Uncharacterized protein n=1 Tax=Hymenobacter canadensis TaxID=2999067 RepID=A0ABY7LN32_9BACT|nr:hypothetical protein [Hymenobacter canadensis]WBA41853.1 hypothetical protein O3303_18845 [Hymenobacter canadensis]